MSMSRGCGLLQDEVAIKPGYVGKGTRPLLAMVLGVMVLLMFSNGVAYATFITAGTFGNSGSGNGQFGPAAPIGIAIDKSTGDIYLSDLLDNRVEKFDSQGAYLSQFGSGGSGSGEFLDPVGVAVEQSSGDVYVTDLVNARVEKFDASGNFILMFGGGVDQTTGGNVCTASSGDVCGAGSSGSGNGQFAGGFGWFGNALGVDSSGDVYVADGGNGRVEKFDSQGKYLSQITSHLSSPRSVAVDPTGNLYVADAGAGAVEKFDSSGSFLAAVGSGTDPTAVTTDAAGDLFAFANAPGAEILEYGPTGTQIDTIGANAIASSPVNPGIAYGDGANSLYVAQPSGNDVWIFTQPTPPEIEAEFAVQVTGSTATLGARIGPGGFDATYHFDYGTTTAYGQTAPIPAGDTGSGLKPRAVWATAFGLLPNTTYHYRVVATNSLGTVVGPDRTFTTETLAEASCPNEQFRDGFSAGLPDCRAYELVTPPNEASAEPDPLSYEIFRENMASSDGSRMSYYSIASLPKARADGESYLSTRGADGWFAEDVIPLQSYYAFECPIRDASMPAYSADLSEGVLRIGGNQRADDQFGGGCGAERPQVVDGEPQGVENLLLRDNSNGTYKLINVTPPGVTPADAHFVAASSDLNRVVFQEAAQLAPGAEAEGVENLYEWEGGAVRLVTVLPDGTPAIGSPAGISADGSRVFFNASGKLYARTNGSSTLQLDASQAKGSGGGSRLLGASGDGARVFFVDDASAGLTGNTVPGSGANLYRYDFGSGQLSDLTPQAGAEVQGMAGVSEDGSYVYFVADGVLADNENAHKEKAILGQANLYLNHEGKTRFIATVSTNDFCVSEGTCVRVSSDGVYLAFTSSKSLTGYDNTGASGVASSEIFLYNADSHQLVCASCNPSGEAPTGGAIMERRYGGAPRYLSDRGRVFFDTPDALLPSDTNGQRDVYEYENGQLHLITTGTSLNESWLLDASAGGDDVFFLTRQKLLPQDTNEEALSIYDAHVDGGFPAVPSSPPCGTADACRAAVSPQPPIYGAPASQTFSGIGNIPPSKAKPKKKRPKKAACKTRHNRRKRAGCSSRAKRKHTKAKLVKGGRGS
jgi:Tol biopolymer transport system component